MRRRMAETAWTRALMRGPDSSFLRYLAVGGSLFLIDFAAFLALVRGCGLDLRLAQAVSRSAGAGVGFFAHRHLSFRATGDRATFHWFGQSVGYTAAAVVLNVAVSPFVVWVTFRMSGGRLILAKLVSDALMAVLSYILLRIVFRTRQHARAGVRVPLGAGGEMSGTVGTLSTSVGKKVPS